MEFKCQACGALTCLTCGACDVDTDHTCPPAPQSVRFTQESDEDRQDRLAHLKPEADEFPEKFDWQNAKPNPYVKADERRERACREHMIKEQNDVYDNAEKAFKAGWVAREPEIAELRESIRQFTEAQKVLIEAHGKERSRLERELAEAKAEWERDCTRIHRADEEIIDRLSKENAELRERLATTETQRLEYAGYGADLRKERDELKARAESLIEKLEPSEPTFESALAEIDYLHEIEQSFGKQAQRDSDLRILAEKLAGALEGYAAEFHGEEPAQRALAEWAKFREGK